MISDLQVQIPPEIDIYHRTFLGQGLQEEFAVHSNDYISLRYEKMTTTMHMKDIEYPNCESLEFVDCDLAGLCLVGIPTCKTMRLINCNTPTIAFNYENFKNLTSLYFEGAYSACQQFILGARL